MRSLSEMIGALLRVNAWAWPLHAPAHRFELLYKQGGSTKHPEITTVQLTSIYSMEEQIKV
jgi:hypothetical protein